MKKIIYLIIIFLFFSLNLALSFTSNPDPNDIGTGGRDDLSFLKAKNNNLKKGNDALKQAIKYIDKNKNKKANKRLEKALGYFVLAYKETPENLEILYLLGFSYYLIGDMIMSEIYYSEALEVDPQNIIINQKLGELYFNTNRVDLAKEKLKVLANCKCKEYSELKKIISGKKKQNINLNF